MAFEQREGCFSVFINDRKTKDTQPDYTGTLKLNGREYRVAAWWKEGRDGNYLSGKLEPMEKP
jgi:hypothetical protein